MFTFLFVTWAQIKSNHIKNLKKKEEKETIKAASARHQSASTTRQSMNFSWITHAHAHTQAHSNISISFVWCGIFVMIYLFVFTCVRKIIDKRRIVWLSSSFMKNDCIRNYILDSINHHHHRHSGESHAHSHLHIISAKAANSSSSGGSIIQTCVHWTYTSFCVKIVLDKLQRLTCCRYIKKVTVSLLLHFNTIPNVFGFTHCVHCFISWWGKEKIKLPLCVCVSFIQSISISSSAKLSIVWNSTNWTEK